MNVPAPPGIPTLPTEPEVPDGAIPPMGMPVGPDGKPAPTGRDGDVLLGTPAGMVGEIPEAIGATPTGVPIALAGAARFVGEAMMVGVVAPVGVTVGAPGTLIVDGAGTPGAAPVSGTTAGVPPIGAADGGAPFADGAEAEGAIFKPRSNTKCDTSGLEPRASDRPVMLACSNDPCLKISPGSWIHGSGRTF